MSEGRVRVFAQGEHPRVAVVHSWTDATPCNLYLRRLVDKVKDGVRVAGGTPVEVPVSVVCEAGAASSLVSRDVLADAAELVISGAGCDGLVAVAGCGNAVAAFLMAMTRLDLPGLLLYGGSPEDASRVGAPPCPAETTASVMAIVAQMLGLSPLGFSDIAAGDARKDIAAVRCGELALRLLERDRRPRQILARAAFENAAAALAATVGGVGALVNLLALAREANVPLAALELDGIAARTPTLLDATPDRFKLAHFEQIGGTRLLARRLLDARLLRDGLTVSGATIFEEARRADEAAGQELLRTLTNPIASAGSFLFLRGSLAPDGCLAAAAVPALSAHSGPARVFDSDQACLDAIAQQRIAPGDVLVVRYQGPKGGPGLRQTQGITAALIAAGLDGQVALVSDGRTGGRSAGLSIGMIAPEAFVGGPLAFVREGDVITIDLGKRSIDVGGDLDARRFNDSWQKPAPRFAAGAPARYAASVLSALDGAICAAGRPTR